MYYGICVLHQYKKSLHSIVMPLISGFHADSLLGLEKQEAGCMFGGVSCGWCYSGVRFYTMCLYIDESMCLFSLFTISKFMKSTYDDNLFLVCMKISFIHFLTVIRTLGFLVHPHFFFTPPSAILHQISLVCGSYSIYERITEGFLVPHFLYKLRLSLYTPCILRAAWLSTFFCVNKAFALFIYIKKKSSVFLLPLINLLMEVLGYPRWKLCSGNIHLLQAIFWWEPIILIFWDRVFWNSGLYKYEVVMSELKWVAKGEVVVVLNVHLYDDGEMMNSGWV